MRSLKSMALTTLGRGVRHHCGKVHTEHDLPPDTVKLLTTRYQYYYRRFPLPLLSVRLLIV
ncbi:hypothetical protein KCP71_12700 [Salmonella enterica subsp. enterica]|nr:hypothetical protein KCP71_12700 [Salmonella enterica subsp. enterica]